MFKIQNELYNNFCFKDSAPQIVTSGGMVFKFHVNYGMNPIMENVLHIFL